MNSSNDDTNSLNLSNKYEDPNYFRNLQGNMTSKSLSIFHRSVLYQKNLTNFMQF